MTISARTPTVDQILDIADSFGLHLTIDDAKSFRGIMAGTMASYARVDELVEPKPAVKMPANSIATSAIGCQVKSLACRIARGVIRTDTSVATTRIATPTSIEMRTD